MIFGTARRQKARVNVARFASQLICSYSGLLLGKIRKKVVTTVTVIKTLFKQNIKLGTH